VTSLPDQPVSRRRITSFQRNLLLVIFPALIAGFFAILPTVYTVLVKDRTTLSYNIVSGPSIPADHGYLRIFAIGIENTGKTPLDKVSIELISTNAQIENLVAEKSALRPTITNDPSSSLVSIVRMLPGDHLSISAMTRSDRAEPVLTANVRSDAVAGTKEELDKKAKLSTGILGAALATIAVGVTSVSYMYWRYTRGISDLSVINPNLRENFVTLILGLSQTL
jgi:hypothetical protein